MACRETNNTDIILPLCAVKENGVISAAKVNSVFYCRFAEDRKRAACYTTRIRGENVWIRHFVSIFFYNVTLI
jgi:hypothetical protein